MKIFSNILLGYAIINYIFMLLSAVAGIWFLTFGFLWLFFMGAVFFWPFWWVIEFIKFGELSIFGFVNMVCFLQGTIMLILFKVISVRLENKANIE